MDIVERLRDRAFKACGPTMEAVHKQDIRWQAADEIERLREALQKNQRPEGETIQGVIDWIKEEPDRLMQFRAALKETE